MARSEVEKLARLVRYIIVGFAVLFAMAMVMLVTGCAPLEVIEDRLEHRVRYGGPPPAINFVHNSDGTVETYQRHGSGLYHRY